MREFVPAAEAEKLLNTTVIPSWHAELKGASICCLEDTATMKSKGRIVLAKIRKSNPVEHHLTGHDLFILISGPVWHTLSDKQKIALLDHEICHVSRIVDEDTGEVSYRLVGHDLEEFRAIVERHGMWSEDIVEFDASLRQHQLEL